jgi:nudix-type nucleoside diphosphatase (YffH/AdpP family)
MDGATETFSYDILYRGWNRFGIATLRLPDGSSVQRVLEDHGEAACVLPYDPARKVALLVRQARVGPMFWGEAGDIDEAPAGGLDGGEPEATAMREVYEETGARVATLEFVMRCYTMPSASTERINLYLAPYAATDRVGPGGGLAHEGEHIETREVALADLAKAADTGALVDMKTLVLVLTLRQRRPELFT